MVLVSMQKRFKAFLKCIFWHASIRIFAFYMAGT